ncbi:MAG: DUF5602 domain-containing protein [Chitinophagaceae bacterium]|nr:DUF5602 domain-containing protein [Chitinophagaceae bacterium]
MKKLFVILALSTTLFSCKKDNDKEKVFKGPVEQFQMGKAWTWYQEDSNGKPLAMGVSIDDAAMKGLDRNGGTGHMHENNIVLKLHPKAQTVFNHVGLGWNPQGHEPEPIYGKPHFDFHFYMTTPQEVAAIPPYEVDSTKFKNWPAAAYFPATYINPGGGVPQMGAHWIDVTSPELSGALFTQTFIYGSYDGKVTFYEPMITEQFILNNPSFERAIPQPAKVQKTGYYPTKMKIITTNGIVNIIIDGFVLRQAS